MACDTEDGNRQPKPCDTPLGRNISAIIIAEVLAEGKSKQEIGELCSVLQMIINALRSY